ncbi:hypothetical protein LaPh949_gp125 [Lactococcus phage 949]|uniref:CD1375-like domain-containing protein n=1 Tax=Lactococcus phage 949 TaxID=881953 RepID=E0YJ12_9CAUD|nr:hypothetical protein LaPh949_gp125 [Lactococcus phage 949]ADM73683.1 hypothetical protein [Lactococcus phage 949]
MAYEAITTLYALNILEGKITSARVPAFLKKQVEARIKELDKSRDEDGNIILTKGENK